MSLRSTLAHSTILRSIAALGSRRRARALANSWEPSAAPARETPAHPFRDFFYGHTEGRGVWKFDHYLDVYQRHLGKFIGCSPGVLEIGIYSGGSIDMWHEVFGNGTRVFGVDIAPETLAYQDGERTQVFIGDQASREFWARVRPQIEHLNVVIDDGGHRSEQQIVTLQETLPLVAPGGVYICEDVMPEVGRFGRFAQELAGQLHDPVTSAPWQRDIEGVHFYPYMVVIEKRAAAVAELHAPKQGTEWAPIEL